LAYLLQKVLLQIYRKIRENLIRRRPEKASADLTEILWGCERTAVVTFNPTTMRKKLYDHTRKLERLRAELIEYRRKYNHKERNRQSATAVAGRYRKLCDQLHINHKCYRLGFENGTMSFRKDASEIGAIEATMGKNIIVTDNHGWSTEDIVSASLDRYRIEP
jgi:transposase